jgi:hypothetical protein
LTPPSTMILWPRPGVRLGATKPALAPRGGLVEGQAMSAVEPWLSRVIRSDDAARDARRTGRATAFWRGGHAPPVAMGFYAASNSEYPINKRAMWCCGHCKLGGCRIAALQHVRSILRTHAR